MTTKKLSIQQARWAEFLSGFNFVISHIPGRENGKVDSLTLNQMTAQLMTMLIDNNIYYKRFFHLKDLKSAL